MSKKINITFKNKQNTKNIKSKLNLLGDKILRLTLKEINYLLKRNEN
jgi:hypothetical protein